MRVQGPADNKWLAWWPAVTESQSWAERHGTMSDSATVAVIMILSWKTSAASLVVDDCCGTFSSCPIVHHRPQAVLVYLFTTVWCELVILVESSLELVTPGFLCPWCIDDDTDVPVFSSSASSLYTWRQTSVLSTDVLLVASIMAHACRATTAESYRTT